MLSAPATALDVPQTLPAAPPSLHQTPEWYEGQATNWPTNIVFGSRARRLTGSDFLPPCSYEQARPIRDYAEQLRSLQQHYTILDSIRLIIALLEEEPALCALLVEAVRPLKNAFGERRIIHVRGQFSDDNSFLKVAVQLPADFGGDPERALWSFDGEWWRNNCHRSGGALVFDYEIQDAV